jgi:hypothetical protein
MLAAMLQEYERHCRLTTRTGMVPHLVCITKARRFHTLAYSGMADEFISRKNRNR